jgi:MFS family permease
MFLPKPTLSAKEQHEKQFGITTKEKPEVEKKVIDQKDFTPYAWAVLAILLAVRIAHGVNQASLGYIFGFKGDGIKAGDPIFEMRSAFPSLLQNYSLLSGPAFSISYSIAGIFMGLLVDKVNRKTLLAMACIGWSLTSIVSGTT